MQKKGYRKLLHIVLSVCLLVSLLPAVVIHSSALSIYGVDGNVTYTKSGSPVLIDSNMYFDDDVSGTYIEVHPTQGFTTGDILTILSDTSPTASGAISIDGDTVYEGTGSGRRAVATVDSYYNGTNGKSLRFNFEASFVNGDFSQSINTGWTPYNSVYTISGDSGSGLTTTIGIESGMVKMYIHGYTDSYGTAHGPYIMSDSFQANSGDAVSVYLKAVDSGDDYDVYGYLKNTSTGALTQLFYERGDSCAKTISGTIPSTGNWQFLFICGSYDATGGTVVGSTMYIDNVILESAQLDQSLANSILQHVGFSTTTSSVTSSVRKWNVRYGTSSSTHTSSGTGTINVKLAPPTSVSFSAGINSIGMSYSASGAQSYDIYKVDSSTTVSNQSSSYTDTGLTPNTLYTYQIRSKNAGVDLTSDYSTTFSEYTLAAVPGISAVNQTPDTTKNDLTINANGNPAGTTYIIQYSTDNLNWSNLKTLTATTYTDPGLSADTTYYYRVCAVNGDNVASSFSSSVSAKTNDSPEISSLSPELDIYRSEVTGYTTITLSGTVTDHDNNTVTVSATANGVEKTDTVGSTASGASWSLSWDVLTDSFAENTYTGIVITADDGTGKSNATSSATWTDTLYVDKTSPGAPDVTHETAWTNASSVTVTMTNGTDTGDVVTGADHTEYRYRTVDADDGSVISDWTDWATYTDAFNITAAGLTTIEAVTVDRAGNRSEAATSVVRIDRTDPVGGSFTLMATYEDEYDNETYTREQTVNLKNISGSESGGDLSETEPTYMEVSNSSDFTVSSGWVPYNSEYNGWALTAGDGEKTVYIRFKDSVGNVSAAITDTIIFDSTSPVIAISAPSRYAAKCGLSVSYTLTIDDETATLYGINADDTSYVALSATGTVEDKLSEMSGWISIENTDGTHREVTITLPSDLVEEGTIAIAVSRAAAIDPAGNESVTVPGNFSFNVDSTPPTHQNELFTEDLTITGGGAVTLAAASADCDGGQDGDSVRFAPVGYDGEAPANGETITSTHGRSSDIIAPTEEGTYKLYIIDEAGNVSEATEATLTVKNLGPSITVEGPSDDYVQAADSVEYIVTYSDDTQEITLSQMDVTLETTGTANAYVEVSEIDGEPLRRKITLNNLMGEGTVAIRIAMGSATDYIGNPAAAYSSAEMVTVDNTAAVVSNVSIGSSNALDTAFAKEGDTITVTFETSEAVQVPEVLINERGASVTGNAAKTQWTASYTIPAGTSLSEGLVTLSIVTSDLAGNVSDAVTAVTDGTSVTMDFTRPEITLTGALDETGAYYTGSVTVEYDSGTAELEDMTTGAVTGINSGDTVSTPGKYHLTVTDTAGNESSTTFILSQDYYDVISDRNALDILYAAGDSAVFVTRNVTLPTSGDNGSSISWAITSGTAVAVDANGDTVLGVVDRPVSGSDDAAVVITATIEKNGFSTTKVFNLTVIAEGGDTPEEKAEDDANSAAIVYASGDSQDNVTQDVSLAAVGVLHGSQMSWSCDSPYLTIGGEAEDGYYGAAVTRPSFEEGDVTVTLTVTATLTEGEDESEVTGTSTKTVTITIKKQDGTPEQLASADAATAYITYQSGDSAERVKQDITLVYTGEEGSVGVWSSSNTDVISIDGETGLVYRPTNDDGDATVTVTLTVTNGEAVTERTFELTVIALDSTPEQDEEDVQNDVDLLEISYRGEDNKDSVTTHLILVGIGVNGSAIIWESDNAAVAGDGTVTRSADGDVVVTLTATVIKGESTATRSFTVKVIQMPLTLLEQLGADADTTAIEYLAGNSAESVVGNLTLMSVGANGCTITWTSSDTSIITNTGKVIRPAETTQVTLTAAIEKNGFIIYKSFTLTVLGL